MPDTYIRCNDWNVLADWSVIHNQLRDALRQVRRLMSHLDK